MATRILRILLLVCVRFQCSLAANIVILTFPTFGHISGPVTVGAVLQNQGHNVTMAIPRRMRNKLEGRGVNLLLYDSLEDFDVNAKLEKAASESFFGRSTSTVAVDVLRTFGDKLARDEQLLEDVKALNADLFILDSTPPARLLVVIPYKLDIPFMFLGPDFEPQFARVPILPSVVPHRVFGFTDQMTFPERFINTLLETVMYFVEPLTLYPNIVSMYAPEKPPISLHDLQAKGLLWIVTKDGILDYNAPTMPNIIRVSHFLTPKLLPQEYGDFMDNAKDGVVVVSFGSILKTIPSETLDKLLAAFRQTNYTFVMRYSMLNSSTSGKFLFSDWLPQFDLLRHKNTRLFITHCGSNGQQEALFAGVPMIGFPVFADQPHNAARIVRKGFGLKLDLRTFSVEQLASAIEEVISNPGYTARIQKASAIVRASRVPPVEEAVFWINHVLKFGADHLRSFGQDIPLWQYLGLDVLAVVLLVWHFFLFMLIKVFCLCFRQCCQSKRKTKTE